MHLHILRHGECLGQCDPDFYTDPDSPLSALGKKQAQESARVFNTLKLTHVVSSPLIRSLETASFIAGDLNFQVWTDVREGFSRSHQGRSLSDLKKRFPKAVFPNDITESGWQHGDDLYDDWQPRCQKVVHKLREDFTHDDHVALVTHGGFANYLLHMLLDLSFQAPLWFELGNCSISSLRFVENPEKERPNWPLYPPVTIEVLSLNDQSHLGSLEI